MQGKGDTWSHVSLAKSRIFETAPVFCLTFYHSSRMQNLIPPLLRRQNGQRRAAFGQRALAGSEVEAVAMIVAADLACRRAAARPLSNPLLRGDIGARTQNIFPRRTPRAPGVRRGRLPSWHRLQFTDTGNRNITHSHRTQPPSVGGRAGRASPGRAIRRSCALDR